MASTVTKAHKLGRFMLERMGLDGPSDPAAATAWATGTAYAVGDYRRPTTPNGWVYRCVKAGTSHASVEPTWPTAADEVVTDNTATWQAMHKGVMATLFSTLTFDADTHDYYDDIASSELATGNGYTNGGKCLTDGKPGSYDATNDRTPYTADPTTWTASGGQISARYAVLRLNRGTNALSPILCVHDFAGAQVAADGAPWKLRYNSADADGAVFYI